METDLLKKVVSLCKRRGFIYPGSDIYGGFANTYSYGPYGAQLKKNIKDLWWKRFVQHREDMVGLDGPILLHPKAWEASGHTAAFNDALIDCKDCKSRFRADHLLEAALHIDVEGLSLEEINEKVNEHHIKCPKCTSFHWTLPRHFNLMFSTKLAKTAEGNQDVAYLRPETAQAIFLDFKHIIDTMRVQIPFGVAQIGKAFRNEITPGHFLFRVIEFEQMEIEYFIKEETWQSAFETWLLEMRKWCEDIGLPSSHLTLYEHLPEKLSHYSKRTVDILYDFPFGRAELYGLAYRTDFDLKQHAEHAKVDLHYLDPQTHQKFIPHVIEPTFGLDRTVLALLCSAYEEETLENGEMRTVLHLSPRLAPIQVAIFPLMKKEPLAEKARTLFKELGNLWYVQYDESGAIGKRYRRHDEIGTPFCITVDYQTLEDNTVTLRDRDSMKQERVSIDSLVQTLHTLLS